MPTSLTYTVHDQRLLTLGTWCGYWYALGPQIVSDFQGFPRMHGRQRMLPFSAKTLSFSWANPFRRIFLCQKEKITLIQQRGNLSETRNVTMCILDQNLRILTQFPFAVRYNQCNVFTSCLEAIYPRSNTVHMEPDLHIGPQGSHLKNCYYHQDQLWWPFPTYSHTWISTTTKPSYLRLFTQSLSIC